MNKTMLLMMCVAMVACGKSQPTHVQETPPTTTVVPPSPTVSAAPTPAMEVAEVKIASVANGMAYDTTTITVKAGQTVHLTLVNKATAAVMSHNWVLTNPGKLEEVALAGMKMGEPAGFVDVRNHDMLAHTPLAKPGETVETTFTAPTTPGKYQYGCSYNGHFVVMKGMLVVE